jgi:hypothetical protein
VSDPTTTNAVAAEVNKILAELIEGAGETAAEATAIAAYPWLGWPFVKQIFEGVLSYVSGLVYRQAALVATQIIVDAQINLEESTTYGAFQNLQLAVASGDKNAITQATADLDKAYGALIHYDGSTPT